MKKTASVYRRNLAGALVLAIMMATSAGARAQTDEPLADPSSDLVRRLLSKPERRGFEDKAFNNTSRPDHNGICPGAGASAAKSNASETERNLVIVPMATANAPRINLAIEFATGSDAIAVRSQAVLDRIARVVSEPGMNAARFAVAGHTDRTGSVDVNLRLSCARAISVRRYLISAGVAPERLTAYGFGSVRPIDPAAIESARNRRVELRRAD
jgi:outer membrane protein OmpA-like peptidoglycan-associated protein